MDLNDMKDVKLYSYFNIYNYYLFGSITRKALYYFAVECSLKENIRTESLLKL